MSRSRQHKLPLHRLWAAWLAVLLVLFGSLAPAVSHALAPRAGAPGTEICTGHGTQILPADSPAGPESALSPHCPFCLHSADRVAPPPQPMPYLLTVQGGQQEAMVWQAFFFASRTDLTPPSRGPPEHPLSY